MHEPGQAPPAATGGPIGTRATPTLPVIAVVVAVVVAAYASLLGHWFYSDDFAHLLLERDLGFGGFLRFLLFADFGERPWVYWRPGWVGLFQLVNGCAGTTPWPYHLVCIGLHAVASVAVFAVARRAVGSVLLAFAAALLFALMPSHAEAVA